MQDAVFSPALAVMTAEPESETTVTLPFLSTVATPVLLDDHCTSAPLPVVATRTTESPFCIARNELLREM